MWEWTYSSAHY